MYYLSIYIPFSFSYYRYSNPVFMTKRLYSLNPSLSVRVRLLYFVGHNLDISVAYAPASRISAER
jgi:hypothetical protein